MTNETTPIEQTDRLERPDTERLDLTEALDAAEHEATAQQATTQQATAAPGPQWLKGPTPTPTIIGLIGLLTLVGSAVWALTDWSVNWAIAAPVGVVLLGLVIIVLGLSGLRRPRT